MIKVLNVKKRVSLIDGFISKPLATNSFLDSYKHCNDMMASWIINAFTSKLVVDAIYVETSRDL